jgi:hypothetical protein
MQIQSLGGENRRRDTEEVEMGALVKISEARFNSQTKLSILNTGSKPTLVSLT